MIYNVLIVDDEPIARQIIEGYLSKITGLHLIKSCENAFEAIEAIRKNNVDIIFLDINMPHLSGISLIKSLTVSPKIIITSAYQEYAIESFELAVTDYLLKPFSMERFVKAVDKAINELTQTSKFNKDYLFIKSDGKIIKINFDEIYYVEAYGNYIKIHCHNKMYVSAQTITSIEQELPTSAFIRVHKSYVINFKHLKSIEGNRISINSFEIPVGDTYKKRLFEKLNLSN